MQGVKALEGRLYFRLFYAERREWGFSVGAIWPGDLAQKRGFVSHQRSVRSSLPYPPCGGRRFVVVGDESRNGQMPGGGRIHGYCAVSSLRHWARRRRFHGSR